MVLHHLHSLVDEVIVCDLMSVELLQRDRNIVPLLRFVAFAPDEDLLLGSELVYERANHLSFNHPLQLLLDTRDLIFCVLI